MTGHKEPDPEGDAADTASLDDADDTCADCGKPLGGLEYCSDPTCPGSDEYDDDDEYDELPEGMLGEDDDEVPLA